MQAPRGTEEASAGGPLEVRVGLGNHPDFCPRAEVPARLLGRGPAPLPTRAHRTSSHRAEGVRRRYYRRPHGARRNRRGCVALAHVPLFETLGEADGITDQSDSFRRTLRVGLATSEI